MRRSHLFRCCLHGARDFWITQPRFRHVPRSTALGGIFCFCIYLFLSLYLCAACNSLRNGCVTRYIRDITINGSALLFSPTGQSLFTLLAFPETIAAMLFPVMDHEVAIGHAIQKPRTIFCPARHERLQQEIRVFLPTHDVSDIFRVVCRDKAVRNLSHRPPPECVQATDNIEYRYSKPACSSYCFWVIFKF